MGRKPFVRQKSCSPFFFLCFLCQTPTCCGLNVQHVHILRHCAAITSEIWITPGDKARLGGESGKGPVRSLAFKMAPKISRCIQYWMLFLSIFTLGLFIHPNRSSGIFTIFTHPLIKRTSMPPRFMSTKP